MSSISRIKSNLLLSTIKNWKENCQGFFYRAGIACTERDILQQSTQSRNLPQQNLVTPNRLDFKRTNEAYHNLHYNYKSEASLNDNIAPTIQDCGQSSMNKIHSLYLKFPFLT